MQSEKGDGPKSQKGPPDPRHTLSITACGSGKIVKIVGLDLGASPIPFTRDFPTAGCRLLVAEKPEAGAVERNPKYWRQSDGHAWLA